MINGDTIKLLRECDAGVRMGISSIKEVLEYVSADELKKILEESLDENQEVQSEINELLDEYHDDGKEPNVAAKSMSWLKTNIKLTFNESDKVIADLMTDGCHMGMKSLNKYLNQYQEADEKSKKLTKKLIGVQEKMAENVKKYL